jgi:amino acid transporter
MKQPVRKRDPSFLVAAALAGAGGLLAIGFAVAMPFWTARHGRPWTSAFSLIAAWGCAALAGCYAALSTYFASGDPPETPPKGGVRAPGLRVLEGGKRADAPTRERNAA